MRVIQRICSILLLLVTFGASALYAQTYDKLWKQVEQAQKKSLPQTVIKLADEIYRKGRQEQNAPQMLKAYICRETYQEGLTPGQPLLQSEIYGILGTIGEESGEQGYSTFFVGI